MWGLMVADTHDAGPVRLGAFIGEVTFSPADPPRDGVFLLWRPVPGFGRPGRARLAVPGREGVGVAEVDVATAPMAATIPWLARSRVAGSSASLLAWRAVVRAGLALIAGGKLWPSMTASGRDCWRAGPLDDDDRALLASLAGALPAPAHAVVLAGGDTAISSPLAAVRACWDAIADSFPRTAAAPIAFGGPLYTDPGSDGARNPLALHAQRASSGSTRVEVRVEVPSGGEPRLERLASAGLGYGAQVALHRGARRWAPLAGIVSARTAPLADGELESLYPAQAALASVGVDIALPQLEELEARAVVASPRDENGSPFSLDALLEFRWELTAGSERLTAAEVEDMIRRQRGVARVRDRWVRIDPELFRLIRHRLPRLRAGEALGASLIGSLKVRGRAVPVSAAGGLEDLRRRVSEVAGPREVPAPPGLDTALRGYQRRGLAWLQEMCGLGLGGCLADDMGLGKTIQVIALRLTRGTDPVLVVCPTSVLGNWEHEIQRFAPGVPVRRYHGESRDLDRLAPGEMVLTTYGILRRDRGRLARVEWDLVVADEAQQVKNPASSAARELRRLPARVRLALTGTPVENRLLDLWAILDWTTPGLLGSREAFRAWTAPIERGDDERAEARLRELVRPFLLRRRKTDPDIAPELPRKAETDHQVPLTAEQAGLYQAVVGETMDAVAGSSGIQRRGLVLKLITRLKQVCDHPALYLGEEGPLAGRSGKLDWLDEQIDVILAGGEAALVFTQYVKMARLLERRLAARCQVALLHGGVAADRRDRMVSRFQAGEVPLLIVSLRAGGFGLNLTRASHVVHFDRWWNPAVEDQATDRAHRIGQLRMVEVHRLMTEGTVEERIAALLASKRDLAERVTGGGEGWISELSDEELSDLVTLRRAS